MAGATGGVVVSLIGTIQRIECFVRAVNILVVTNDFPPRVGGIQSYVHEILERLDNNVCVLASASPGATEFDANFRHRVVRVPTSTLLPTPGVLSKVVGLVQSTRPDVVLFGAAVPLALLGPIVRRRTGTPYVTFTHGVEPMLAGFRGGRTLLTRILRSAALVTVVSDWALSRVKLCVGSRTRLERLPSGVDVRRFHPGVDDRTIRRRHGLESKIVIGCVSRLVRRKGQDAVLDAVASLAREHPRVAGLIVGGGRDERFLRRHAKRRGISNRVVFAGEVAGRDLPAYFRASDIFAMPCRTRWGGLDVEALGAVFLQAAAVGRPVIAGRSGGAPEAVVEGETGLVVDGRRTEAVVQAIQSLLRDPARSDAMGTRGAERVSREFSWDRIAAAFRSALVSALDGGS